MTTTGTFGAAAAQEGVDAVEHGRAARCPCRRPGPAVAARTARHRAAAEWRRGSPACCRRNPAPIRPRCARRGAKHLVVGDDGVVEIDPDAHLVAFRSAPRPPVGDRLRDGLVAVGASQRAPDRGERSGSDFRHPRRVGTAIKPTCASSARTLEQRCCPADATRTEIADQTGEQHKRDARTGTSGLIQRHASAQHPTIQPDASASRRSASQAAKARGIESTSSIGIRDPRNWPEYLVDAGLPNPRSAVDRSATDERSGDEAVLRQQRSDSIQISACACRISLRP